MKLTITKRNYNRLMSGLYLAAAYEDSLADANENIPVERKKANRRARMYRALRTKLYNATAL